MVTINPAEYYSLSIGALMPGRYADIVEVTNLRDFEIRSSKEWKEMVLCKAYEGRERFQFI